MIDNYAQQQKEFQNVTEKDGVGSSHMNFTNVNGIQYISIVDERNRRGRPPKVKKDVQTPANLPESPTPRDAEPERGQEDAAGDEVVKREIEVKSEERVDEKMAAEEPEPPADPTPPSATERSPVVKPEQNDEIMEEDDNPAELEIEQQKDEL